MSTHRLAGLCIVTILVAACAQPDPSGKRAVPGAKTPEPEPVVDTCTTDADGDGFGPDCTPGEDCDDADPEVTNECYKCAKHAPGCACDTDGERVDCGTVVVYEGDRKICGLGGQVCEDGHWSTCVLGALPPGQAQGLGPPTGNCGIGAGTPGSVCDPYCQYFNDSPSGLPNGDGYVASDGGITLVPKNCQ